jgi:hypothetical protein
MSARQGMHFSSLSEAHGSEMLLGTMAAEMHNVSSSSKRL